MSRKRRHFSAKAACEVCHVTPRNLDYWITTGVIEPTGVFECDRDDGVTKRRRAYHLFDFAALMQIKIVKDLREAGVSLQRVRSGLQALRSKQPPLAGASWIVTDGHNLFTATEDPQALESLLKTEKGQLVFSVIALGAARTHVRTALRRCIPFQKDRYHGRVKEWAERTISA